MYCVQCGTKNPEDARFCKQCGRRMEPPTEDQAGKPAEVETTSAPSVAPAPSPAELVPDPEARYRELMAQAFRHYARGEYEPARDACHDALDLRADMAEAHALLSTIYERMGDIEKAIEERERVLELNPASLADREKLDALRSGIVRTGQMRIMSVREYPGNFWDSPAGAAVAAIAATIVVIIIGYAIISYREGRNHAAGPTESVAQNTVPQTSAGSTANAGPAMSPAFSGAPPAPQVQQSQQQQPPMQPSMQGMRQNSGSQQPAMPPLQLRPEQQPLEPSAGPPGTNTGGTFFDPGQPTNSGAPPPAQTKPPDGAGSSSSSSPGRIEIVVAPQGDGGANPSPNAPPNVSGADMESRNNAEIARNLQTAGRYREAAQAWERALAGSGANAPRYHQMAALCYQRIGDKANARRHYSEAIRGYRDATAQGADKDATAQAIQACEAGLKLCQ